MTSRLSKYLVARTRRADDLREAYAKVYAEPKLTLKDERSLEAVVSQCPIGDVRIGYGRFAAAASWEFPNADCYLYLVPIDGTGMLRTRNNECEIVSGKTVMISPAAGYIADYDASFEAFSVKLGESLLARKLEAIVGEPIHAPVVFEPASPDGGVDAMLRDYVCQLVGTIEESRADWPAWWTAQTEQLISTMLLCARKHNYSHLLDRSSAVPSASQVRRAESYIEANCDRPIAIEDLTEVTGVNALSLYRAFKTIRGYSPMQFAARVRREKELFSRRRGE